MPEHQCVICYEEVIDEPYRCKRCHALMHKSCFDAAKSMRCPICRQFMLTEENRTSIIRDLIVSVDGESKPRVMKTSAFGRIYNIINAVNDSITYIDDIHTSTLLAAMNGSLFNRSSLRKHTSYNGFDLRYRLMIDHQVENTGIIIPAPFKDSSGHERYLTTTAMKFMLGIDRDVDMNVQFPYQLLSQLLTGKSFEVNDDLPIVDINSLIDIWNHPEHSRYNILVEFMKALMIGIHENIRPSALIIRSPFDCKTSGCKGTVFDEVCPSCGARYCSKCQQQICGPILDISGCVLTNDDIDEIIRAGANAGARAAGMNHECHYCDLCRDYCCPITYEPNIDHIKSCLPSWSKPSIARHCNHLNVGYSTLIQGHGKSILKIYTFTPRFEDVEDRSLESLIPGIFGWYNPQLVREVLSKRSIDPRLINLIALANEDPYDLALSEVDEALKLDFKTFNCGIDELIDCEEILTKIHPSRLAQLVIVKYKNEITDARSLESIFDMCKLIGINVE